MTVQKLQAYRVRCDSQSCTASMEITLSDPGDYLMTLNACDWTRDPNGYDRCPYHREAK